MFGIGRDDETVAGADREGLAGNGEGEAAGLNEGRLDMRMMVRGAARAGDKVVRHDHELGAVGEDLADDASSGGNWRKGAVQAVP